MSPETEALARRAVAAGFVSVGIIGGNGRDDRGALWVRAADMSHLPVLADGATLGCLLALVREAWSDPGISTCHMDGYDSYDWVCAVDTDRLAPDRAFPATRNGVTWFNGPTEAAALVAALEAAPVRR